MAQTYYSTFYPAVSEEGAKGTTIAVVPTAVIDRIDQAIGELSGDTGGDGPADNVAPAIPTGLTLDSILTDRGTTLLIGWVASSSPDVSGYDVGVRESGGNWVEFTTSGLRYEIPTAARNKGYDARVRAFDRSGNRSGYTAIVSYTTKRDTEPPVAPTALTATGSFKTVALSWTNPADADLVKIEILRGTTTSFAAATYLATVNADPTGTGTYVDTGLGDNVTRFYWIRAVDSSRNVSPVSAVASATTARLSFESFTPGLEPIGTVTVLPNPNGYTGPKTVYNTTDGNMYNYRNGGWEPISAGEVDNEVTAADIKAIFGGGNLIRNSSFERPGIALGNDGSGDNGTVAAGFGSYNNSGSADRTIWGTETNGRRGGVSQYVQWFKNTSTKGIVLTNNADTNNAGLLRPNSTYILSFYATGYGTSTQAAIQLAWNTPPTVTVLNSPKVSSAWQRYLFKITTGATVDPNIYITTLYVGNGEGVIYFDDIQLEEGEVPTAYAPALLSGEITNELLAAQSIAAINIKSDAIETRHIKVNTIQTNQLMIGSRPVSAVGINMRVRTDGALAWDAGILTYINDQNTPAPVNISANAVFYNGSTIYVVWQSRDKLGSFFATNDKNYISSPDWTHIATWEGGGKLTMVVGVGTIISGDNIVTGSINANKISAKTITTNELAVAAVQAGNIAAGAITVDKLLVQANSTLLNPDPNFRDASIWANSDSSGLYPMRTVPGRAWYNYHTPDLDAIMGGRNYAMLWSDGGSNTAERYHLFSGRLPNIRGGQNYQLKATGRNASNQPMYVYVRFYNVANEYITATPMVFGLGEYTTKTVTFAAPTNATSCELIVFNEAAGTIFAGNMQVSDLQITQQFLGTAIQDGQITTNHITVGTLNGDRISANTITGGAFKTDTSLPGTITVGSTGVTIETVRTTANTANGTANTANITANTANGNAQEALNKANDPAAVIRANSTTINPGNILLQGSTTLGAVFDQTEIRGGYIKSNTITANKLTLANRSLNWVDVSFFVSENGGRLNWTPGYVQYIDSSGIYRQQEIDGGSTITDNYVYIYWTEGVRTLSATNDSITLNSNNAYVVVCTWRRGQKYFLANYGSTIIDGDRITTGTISADKMSVTSLSAISGKIGLLRTADSGARMEMENNQVRAYDANRIRALFGVWS